MSYDIYTGLLKMYNEFIDTNIKKFSFVYEHDHPEFKALKMKYPIEKVAGTGDDLSKAMNLMNWLASNIYHNNYYDNHIPNNANDLLDYALSNGKEHGLNSRSLSIILTECCLSLGIKARTVYIMPLSPYDLDNHAISSVYIKSLDKWVMLDPTYNCYFIDDNNNFLNLTELRNILSNQGYVNTNDEIFYNDKIQSKDRLRDEYISYIAKNLFYFKTSLKNSYNSEANNTFLYVVPVGFDVKKRQIINVQYRINKQGKDDEMNKRLTEVTKEDILYISIDKLPESPET